MHSLKCFVRLLVKPCHVSLNVDKRLLTPLSVKNPTIAGPMKPQKHAAVFVIAYIVPAKVGLIST